MKLLILALLFALCATLSVHSATIHVPADQPNITAGIVAAVPGDTVLVSPGLWVENPSINKQIVLLSVGGWGSTTIRTTSPTSPVITVGSGLERSTVISGFTIDGNHQVRGISSVLASPTIEYCQVQNCASSMDGAGIYLYKSAAIVRNSVIHDNVQEATGGGICVEEGPSSGLCEIYNNLIYQQNQHAAQGIGCLYARNLSIHHNVFKDNTNDSWWASGGIYMNLGAGTVHIFNNTFVNNTRGLVVYGSPQPRFENNIVVGSTLDAIPSGLTNLDYNDIWGNGTNYSGGLHGVSSDPLFYSPSGDFRLQVGSPCIDAGNPAVEFNDPDSSRCDIGAYPMTLIYPYARNIWLGAGTPNRIITPTPTVSWTFADTAGSQTGYEIELANNAGFAGTLLWQTGQVPTSDTTAPYTGTPMVQGPSYWLRIRLSDSHGWGDWLTMQIRLDYAPTVPVPSSPTGGAIRNGNIQLITNNSSDVEGDPLFYDFEVSTDPDFSTIAASRTHVPQGTSRTSTDTLSELAVGHTYYWHVRSDDGYLKSNYSSTATFVLTSVPVHFYRVPVDCPTIQDGIIAASNFDTVSVAPGAYTEFLSLMGKKILLRSDSGATKTTIMAPSKGLILNISQGEDSSAVIDGFTFSGQSLSRGIYCSGVSPIIQNCVFEACSADPDGGGIYCTGSAPIIRNNRFHDCKCPATGSGICFSDSMPGRTAIISGNWFDGQTRESAQGIGCLHAQNLLITRNVFTSNKNDSWWASGGIYMNYGLHVRIISNTFVNNSRALITYLSPQPDFFNNIVSGCTLTPVQSGISHVDYNDSWNNTVAFNPGTHGISADPKFANAAANDYHLTFTSHCIDQGNPATEYNDPDGTRADIGAYYFTTHSPSSFSLIGPPDSTGDDVYTLTPVLRWSPSIDADPGDAVTYQVQVAFSSSFSLIAFSYTTTATSKSMTDTLQNGIRYWWRVTAVDLQGHTVPCNAATSFYVWTIGDMNHSHSVDLADLSLLTAYLTGTAPFPHIQTGDINHDCQVNLADLARLVAYLTGQPIELMGSCAGLSPAPAIGGERAQPTAAPRTPLPRVEHTTH